MKAEKIEIDENVGGKFNIRNKFSPTFSDLHLNI